MNLRAGGGKGSRWRGIKDAKGAKRALSTSATVVLRAERGQGRQRKFVPSAAKEAGRRTILKFLMARPRSLGSSGHVLYHLSVAL